MAMRPDSRRRAMREAMKCRGLHRVRVYRSSGNPGPSAKAHVRKNVESRPGRTTGTGPVAPHVQLRYHTTMHVINIGPELVFQALADATRVRIVRLVAMSREEACLCELVDSLIEPQHKLSRHLKVLRQVGLLATERDGRFLYHRLVTRPAYLGRLVAVMRALPDADGTFAADLRRFGDRMRLRKAGRCRIGIQTPSLSGSTPEFRAAGKH